jgi:hypothetical protein
MDGVRKNAITGGADTMPYEVRVNGRTVRCYAAQRDALAHVREMLKRDCDAEPEIVDSETGKPAEPSATTEWREDLANKVGY